MKKCAYCDNLLYKLGSESVDGNCKYKIPSTKEEKEFVEEVESIKVILNDEEVKQAKEACKQFDNIVH